MYRVSHPSKHQTKCPKKLLQKITPFCHDFKSRVTIFKRIFLRLQELKWQSFSAHQKENYMQIPKLTLLLFLVPFLWELWPFKHGPAFFGTPCIYSFSTPGWQQNRSRSWWDASTPTSSTARSRRGWAGTPWGRRYRCHPSASPTSRPRVNPLLPIPARSQAPAWRFLGLLMTYQGHFMKMFLRTGKILLMLVCWLTLT